MRAENRYQNLDKKYIAITALPILIYFCFALLQELFMANGQIFLFNPNFEPAQRQSETATRIFLFATVSTAMIVTLVGIIFGSHDILKRLGRRQSSWFLLPLIALIAVFVASFCWESGRYSAFGSTNLNSCRNLGFGDCTLNSAKIYNIWFFDDALELRLFLEKAAGISFVTGMWVAMSGTVSCLAIKGKGDPHFSNPYKLLDQYLMLIVVLLVIGVIYLNAMLKWPVFALSDATAISNYKAITNASSLFAAITFSAMIASVYLPVRFYLGKTHIMEHIDEKRGLLSSIGVSAEQKDFYARTLKITSPIIIAIISSFIN